MTRWSLNADEPVGLVAGGPVSDEDIALVRAHTNKIVAADGGAEHLLRAEVMPDAVIGDFDSLGDVGERLDPSVLHHVSEQDSTDFEKCLIRINAPLVVAVGLVGGRVDHLLAALNTLVRCRDRKCIVLGPEDLTFLLPPHLVVQTQAGTTVSLFPLAQVKAQSEGLRWPLVGVPLAPDGRIGTSNRAEGSVRLQCDVAGLLLSLHVLVWTSPFQPCLRLRSGRHNDGVGFPRAAGRMLAYTEAGQGDSRMTNSISSAEAGKFAAASVAVEMIDDGMRLGLGSGSTANWMVRALAARVRRENLKVLCAATSRRTADLATALGVNVLPLNDLGRLDLTIDGADEFDPALNLIKGGGGAHLREKIVAKASRRMVVITDPSKEVTTLGAFPLPIEVLKFGSASTRLQITAILKDLGYGDAQATMRGGEKTFETDEGNQIIDLRLGAITDAQALSRELLDVPGVVETGLFLDICSAVVIGHEDGHAEIRGVDGSRRTQQIDPTAAQDLPVPEMLEG